MPQPKWLISVLESRLPAFLALFGAVSCLYLATLGGAPLDMGKAVDHEILWKAALCGQRRDAYALLSAESCFLESFGCCSCLHGLISTQ
jgi:hypothetical protein